MVGMYARIKPYKVAAEINVFYFDQNRPPKKENLLVKSLRLQLLIGINILSDACDATPSKCDEHDHWIFIYLFPRIKFLVDFYVFAWNFYPCKKD